MTPEEKANYIWDEHATMKGRDFIPENELNTSRRDALLLNPRYVWMRASGRSRAPYGEFQIRRDDTDALALASHEEFVADRDDEPNLADLEKLTVAQLKDLADKEAIDVSDLKLKADLVGRLCAHFGIDI